jgi:demethylmenaquinone methyltransferase/2-methoxy-6-polyprenyl-1,4-benzoquinol methylase
MCVHAMAGLGVDKAPSGAFTPGQEGSARQALFNRISKSYDEVRCCMLLSDDHHRNQVHIGPSYCSQLNNQLSFGQHWVWKRMAVKWSGAKPGQQVLDVCCGSGDLSFLLAKAVGLRGQVSKSCHYLLHCSPRLARVSCVLAS